MSLLGVVNRGVVVVEEANIPDLPNLKPFPGMPAIDGVTTSADIVRCSYRTCSGMSCLLPTCRPLFVEHGLFSNHLHAAYKACPVTLTRVLTTTGIRCAQAQQPLQPQEPGCAGGAHWPAEGARAAQPGAHARSRGSGGEGRRGLLRVRHGRRRGAVCL